MKELLLYLSVKYDNNWKKINHDLDEVDFDLDWTLYSELSQQYNNNYLTILDLDYPKSFKELAEPPFVIYFFGNRNILNYQKIWPKAIKNNVEDLLKIKQFLISSQKHKNSTALLVDVKHSLGELITRNNKITKIFLLEEISNLQFDVKDISLESNLFLSFKPIREMNLFKNKSLNLKTTKKDFKNINELKSKICDKLVLLSTNKSFEDFTSIIAATNNMKEVFLLSKSFEKEKLESIKANIKILNKIEEIF